MLIEFEWHHIENQLRPNDGEKIFFCFKPDGWYDFPLNMKRGDYKNGKFRIDLRECEQSLVWCWASLVPQPKFKIKFEEK